MSSLPDADLDRPHFVYRCYGNDVLLYIGVAEDVPSRMFHHLHPCNRAKVPNGALARYMTHHEVERHPTKLAARAAERSAIAAEAPLLNRQHNPRRFRKGPGGAYVAVAPVHPFITAALT